MLAFARVLPAIRRRVAADLRRPSLSRERVLATVVALLERTLIRVGNDEYARTNGSFGLTTLLDRHVDVRGRRVRFHFRAKSGVIQKIDLQDALLARSVQRCQDLPGQTLFQYVDETGAQRTISSTDVNAYIREVAGEEFTAKDFRTWSGTVLAACALCADIELGSATARKRFVSEAIGDVAARLGNTKAVCRKCYVHPTVIDAFLEGETIAPFVRTTGAAKGRRQLSAEETAVVKLLTRAPGHPHQASRGVTPALASRPRTRQPVAQVRQRFPHGAGPDAPLARFLIRGTVARRLKCHAGFLAKHSGPVAARQLERGV